MMEKKYLSAIKMIIKSLCLWVFLCTGLAQAQINSTYILKGTIIDSSTGKGVPYANVAAKYTVHGTTTDLDGHFTLHLDNPCQLKVTSIGYESIELEITKEILLGELPLNLMLLPYPVVIRDGFGPCGRLVYLYPTIPLISYAVIDMKVKRNYIDLVKKRNR